MTDLMYGGEMGSVMPSSAGVYETTLATTFDATRARCGIRIDEVTDYAESPTFSAQTDCWFHWRQFIAGGASQSLGYPIVIMGGSTEIVRLYTNDAASGNGESYLQWNDPGSTWTTLDTFANLAGALQTYDLHVDLTNDTITLYSSGTNVASGTAAGISTLASMTSCRWMGWFSSKYQVISELIIATTSTVGCAVFTQAPTGNGANTSFTGAYTEVDEIVYSDADNASTVTNDHIETYTGATPTLGNYVVRGIGLGIRGKKGATGPTQMQGCVRTSGTNYFSSTVAQDFGYGALTPTWVVSPATSAAWTTSSAPAAEFGMKAIA